jgi:excisionase family DNA binding protein
LVVADWKRLSRDDPGRVLALVNRLQELGVVILSNEQRELVPWKPLYWVQVALHATMAKEEAESSARMTSKGIREARASGIDWGRAPMGWVRKDYVGHYTDPAERALARKNSFWVPDESDGPRSMDRLRELYRLRDEGWAWHAISRATGFHEASIRVAVLGMPVKVTDESGHVIRTMWPKPPDNQPSNWRNRETVGAALYDRVLARGSGGAPVLTRRQPWLFRGLVHCPFDGSRMTGQEANRNGTKSRYYVCSHPRVVDEVRQRANALRTDLVGAVELTPHPWSHVREDVVVRSFRSALRSLSFGPDQLAAMERARHTPSRQKLADKNEERRLKVNERIRRLGYQHLNGGITDEDYKVRLEKLRMELAGIPTKPLEDQDARVALVAIAIREVADLLPASTSDPEEVVPSMRIIRRLVERIELDPASRRPIFCWTPQVAQTLELARLVGINPSLEEPDDSRDWMSPQEVAAAIGASRTAIARGLSENMIPAERIKGRKLTRYRIPKTWVHQQIADPRPLRQPREVPTATSVMSVDEAAKHLGVAYRTVLRLVREDKIASSETGQGRHTRYLIQPDAIKTEAVAKAVALSRARAHVGSA